MKSELKESGKAEPKESGQWMLKVCGNWTLESPAVGLAWLDDQVEASSHSECKLHIIISHAYHSSLFGFGRYYFCGRCWE